VVDFRKFERNDLPRSDRKLFLLSNFTGSPRSNASSGSGKKEGARRKRAEHDESDYFDTMDGFVKKDPTAPPNGNATAVKNPVAGRPSESIAGREAGLIGLYTEVMGCSEIEARSTYMHVDRAGNTEVGNGS
jgi:hypothetical protein